MRRSRITCARTHGGHGSGDLAIAFSTAQRFPLDPVPLTHATTVLNEQHTALDALFAAVVESTEEAVINALFAARSMDGRDGHLVDALPVDEVLTILRRYGSAK